MNDIEYYKVTIAGASMLMHNGRLADPLDEWTRQLKAVTSKRKKTDDDHLEMGRIEFQGGLYFDDDAGPYVPVELLDAVLREGAKKKRLGTAFASAVQVDDSELAKLEYEGPRDRDGLWANPRFRDRRACGVQGSRVMRTRPKFSDWRLTFVVALLPQSAVNPGDLKQAVIDAGTYCGLGDFRPRFGRFALESFERVSIAQAA